MHSSSRVSADGVRLLVHLDVLQRVGDRIGCLVELLDPSREDSRALGRLGARVRDELDEAVGIALHDDRGRGLVDLLGKERVDIVMAGELEGRFERRGGICRRALPRRRLSSRTISAST